MLPAHDLGRSPSSVHSCDRAWPRDFVLFFFGSIEGSTEKSENVAFQSRKALTTLAPKLHTHTLSSGCGSRPHQHHEQHGTYSCAVQWSHRSWLPCQGLPRLTLLCHAGAAACPLVLAFTSRSDCTVTSFLSPSIRVPLANVLISGSCSSSSALIPTSCTGAPDKCQHLAGPKAQLWSLSRGRAWAAPVRKEVTAIISL